MSNCFLRLGVARQRQTTSTSIKRWRSDFLFSSEILSTWTGVSSRRFDSVTFSFSIFFVLDEKLLLLVQLSNLSSVTFGYFVRKVTVFVHHLRSSRLVHGSRWIGRLQRIRSRARIRLFERFTICSRSRRRITQKNSRTTSETQVKLNMTKKKSFSLDDFLSEDNRPTSLI